MTVRNLANEHLESTITKEQLGEAMAKLDLNSIPPEKRASAVMDHLMRIMSETITDRDKLLNQLDQIREQGYAWTNQEFSVGLKVVGAVIHEPDGSIFGGVSLGAPCYRIEEGDHGQEMIDQVLSAKNRLEKKISRFEE